MAGKWSQIFFVSSRTLKRKLNQEGTSFQKVLDETRKELALNYLQDQKLNLQETSIKLGYSDIANFNRAFKRWFDVPPSQFIK